MAGFIPGMFVLLWLNSNTVLTSGKLDGVPGVYAVSRDGKIAQISNSAADVCVAQGVAYQLALDGGRNILGSGSLETSHEPPPQNQRFDVHACRFVPAEVPNMSGFGGVHFLSKGYLGVQGEGKDLKLSYFRSDTDSKPTSSFGIGQLSPGLLHVQEYVNEGNVFLSNAAIDTTTRNRWKLENKVQFAHFTIPNKLQWHSVPLGSWYHERASYVFDIAHNSFFVHTRISDENVAGVFRLSKSEVDRIYPGVVKASSISPNRCVMAAIVEKPANSSEGSKRIVKFIDLC